MSDLSSESGISFFRASGQSMWPFVRDGQRLIVRAVPFPELRVGDIIVYKADAGIVCHRVVAKRGSGQQSYCFVRGDCTQGAPERVEASMIIGRVCGIVHGTKSVQWHGFTSDIANRAILFIVPVIAFISAFLNRFKKRR
jgi:signal peptidase I